jgi:enoyl-CoA hydratase
MAVDVDIDQGIAVVTMNRPQALNAFNSEQLDLLGAAFHALGQDRTVRVVILTGAGDRAFAAGADIKEMVDLTPAGGMAFGRKGQALTSTVERLPQPVIAAVNGYAFGGGCELAIACDIRLASENARFAQPEVSLGIPPGWGGTQRLPRLIGPGLAAEMIYTGRHVDAEEAQRIGLVNRVVPAAELMKEAKALAGQLAKSAPVAMRYIINAVNKGTEIPFAEACQYEATLFGLVASTEDMREGTAAFLAKRKAEFKGR